jgi:hypothetical protein
LNRARTRESFLQGAELAAELLEAESPLEDGEPPAPVLERDARVLELAGDAGEAGAGERFGERDLAGGVVVAPAVGDAAAEHVLPLVENESFGGGGAEVDADDVPHRSPPRFCSIIWK